MYAKGWRRYSLFMLSKQFLLYHTEGRKCWPNWYFICLSIYPTTYDEFHWYNIYRSWDIFNSMKVVGGGGAHGTNETGPLPLCTFSVMGLSMFSSIFSESSPVRSNSGIINELSGFPNSVPTVRCSVTSSNWHGHTGHAYCICFVGKH